MRRVNFFDFQARAWCWLSLCQCQEWAHIKSVTFGQTEP